MNNQPIIFDLKYTPYSPPKGANEYQLKEHRSERAFYDMTGEKNIYDYITTEGKRSGKFTVLDYLQKNTGVFNNSGMISQEEVAAMKERARLNEGMIWHGFISFNKHDSEKIDTPEKCIRLIRSTFPMFFKEAGLKPENIDLMCALHLDRPHHLHIHFVFWEKEAKYVEKDGTLGFRYNGKINEEAIDNMYVRLGLFANEKKDLLYEARDGALKKLREMTNVKRAMRSKEEIKDAILSLAKDLPTTGRITYGSKDMESFKGRVDKIVDMMLNYDREARRADERFYKSLREKQELIKAICGNDVSSSGKDFPNYHHKIDESKIKIIETIEEDYKRRQGNLVLSLCKFIKPEYYERKKGKKYRANDNALKRRLNISRRNVARRLDKFFLTFGKDSRMLERDFSYRLQEIEEEIERERRRESEENNDKGVSFKN
ncbi:MAG: hypothetical protein IJ706_02265 [Clostridia bacterium]|nr:hypothetical protein [Clostridia bacterium]